MSTATTNGYDHAKGRVVTGEQGVRAHANDGDHPAERPQGPNPARNPMYTRAIPRNLINNKTHTVKKRLRPHLDTARASLTNGWAMSTPLPTGAEALAGLKPTSRWYLWPVDVPANLLSLAAVVLTYLTVNALATQRRRRLALALLLVTAAIPTLTHLITEGS